MSFSIIRTYEKYGITREFLKGATRGFKRGRDGEKFKRSYLRLIPGLCLEDRTN
jgi:hypothetical protein